MTEELPVGTHLSVPIRFSDGRVYGTFCCFALEVRAGVEPDSLRSVQMLADVAGAYLEEADAALAEWRRRRAVIQELLDDPDRMTVVFEPLRDLTTMKIVGVEALARFKGAEHGPACYFNEAADVGLGVELEMRAVHLALAAFDEVRHPIRLNINVSPHTLCSAEFLDAVAQVPRDRLVVEVTEHAVIEDYSPLKTASAALASLGIWLAVDDVGMGFSGLNRIIETSPYELKLDRVVIQDIDLCPVKHALVKAFCSFGEEVGFHIVAEGIETPAELEAVRQLGARIGQGHHLGRPGELDQVLLLEGSSLS